MVFAKNLFIGNVIYFPVIYKSSKFNRLRNMMGYGFMIDEKLRFNILTETPSKP